MNLNQTLRERLLQIARDSIHYGLTHSASLPLPPSAEERLREPGASFVTLKLNGKLRGCMGTLEPIHSLAEDVSKNAYASAFDDPRFPALTESESKLIHIEVSVLSAPQEIRFENEADLLSRLRPGIDGLILEEGPHRATFLPAVWDALPEPEQFLRQLKRKAGLNESHFSSNLRIYRYTTESFS